MKKQIGKNLMQKWIYKSGIISLQKQSGRRYWEQAIICDGTCRQDSYWIAAKF